MDLHPWMLLVPAALSAGAVPVARRHPAVAWTLWGVTALATLVATALFAVAVAFLQTVFGAGFAIIEGDPDGSRGHVDLLFLVPWAVAAMAVVVGTGIAVHRTTPTTDRPYPEPQVDSGVAKRAR